MKVVFSERSYPETPQETEILVGVGDVCYFVTIQNNKVKDIKSRDFFGPVDEAFMCELMSLPESGDGGHFRIIE